MIKFLYGEELDGEVLNENAELTETILSLSKGLMMKVQAAVK